jgi:hypothetical protein
MKPKPQEKNKKATDHPTQRHWHEMNRKQRRETMRKMQSEDLSLEVIHPDAAGIDIGNESHYAAVPPSRDSQPVRQFGCTTELKAMAASIQLASALSDISGVTGQAIIKAILEGDAIPISWLSFGILG